MNPQDITIQLIIISSSEEWKLLPGYECGQTVAGERSEKEAQGMPRIVRVLKQVAESGESF